MSMSLGHMNISVYENTCPSRKGAECTIRERSLTIHPILVSENTSFGAEVFGVDWSKPVPADIIEQVGD
jgi:alpha-ketoglutarate-dependent 2,4-dichlorophenoxyacetate dioxygenase